MMDKNNLEHFIISNINQILKQQNIEKMIEIEPNVKEFKEIK